MNRDEDSVEDIAAALFGDSALDDMQTRIVRQALFRAQARPAWNQPFRARPVQWGLGAVAAAALAGLLLLPIQPGSGPSGPWQTRDAAGEPRLIHDRPPEAVPVGKHRSVRVDAAVRDALRRSLDDPASAQQSLSMAIAGKAFADPRIVLDEALVAAIRDHVRVVELRMTPLSDGTLRLGIGARGLQ